MSKDLKTIWHNRIDSTNSEAKRLAEKGEESPILIAANTQEKGRGRLGREWISETGGCYFSLLLTPKKKFGFTDLSYQQQLIGQKLIHLLYDLTQVELELEWPNDIILGTKKVGGILLEALTPASQDHAKRLILGIGLNMNQKSFPESLKSIATSFYLEKNKEYDLTKVIRHIGKELVHVL